MSADMDIEDHATEIGGFASAIRLIGQGSGVKDAAAACIVIADAIEAHLRHIVELSGGTERGGRQ